MKFKKYSSIENSYREKEVERIITSGIADCCEWVVTEKIHGCVKYDTKITLVNGTEKKICDIKKGDYVLTYNTKTHEQEPKKVLNVLCQNLNKKWVKLHFDNGKTLTITEDHKVYTKNRGYVEASKLNENDELIDVLVP